MWWGKVAQGAAGHQYSGMTGPTDVERALSEGAHRSLRACSLPANDPLPVAFWRRHRWKIIGALLIVLVEFIALGSLITGGMPQH